jgi:CBS domain containing-hemolysin-like protein
MTTTTVGSITRMLLVAAADSTVEPVMLEMQATGVHIAKVMDTESDSMVGIITLDDLLSGLLNELTGGGDTQGTATTW